MRGLEEDRIFEGKIGIPPSESVTLFVVSKAGATRVADTNTRTIIRVTAGTAGIKVSAVRAGHAASAERIIATRNNVSAGSVTSVEFGGAAASRSIGIGDRGGESGARQISGAEVDRPRLIRGVPLA